MHNKILKTKPSEVLVGIIYDDDERKSYAVHISVWDKGRYYYETVEAGSEETALRVVKDMSLESGQQWLNSQLKKPTKCKECGQKIPAGRNSCGCEDDD